MGHGCRVLGTAGTQEGMDLVKSQGAHAVFNHREPGYVDKIQVRSLMNKANRVMIYYFTDKMKDFVRFFSWGSR